MSDLSFAALFDVPVHRPKFDRAAVRDMRVLHEIPRREPPSSPWAVPPALVGIPVFVSPDVEVGVIELRLGDTLYKRLLLAELRA